MDDNELIEKVEARFLGGVKGIVARSIVTVIDTREIARVDRTCWIGGEKYATLVRLTEDLAKGGNVRMRLCPFSNLEYRTEPIPDELYTERSMFVGLWRGYLEECERMDEEKLFLMRRIGDMRPVWASSRKPRSSP